MPNDVEALFRKINQSDLPYHVFEAPEPAPQPRPKPQLVEAAPREQPPEPAPESPAASAPPRRRLLSNYAAPAPAAPEAPEAPAPAGTLLSDIFARMAR